nr:ABC transporter B family member 11 [Ipomoea batatas]
MISKFKTKRTSTGRPACVAEETWAIWEAYWDRPDVKAKSEQHRKNRMSEVEGPGTGCSRHTGGSRSTIKHYHKLEEVQAHHDAATQEAEDSTDSTNINICGSSATSQLHPDAMKDMMNQQLETMRADMEAKLQAEMDAKLQAERSQMQAQMQTQI